MRLWACLAVLTAIIGCNAVQAPSGAPTPGPSWDPVEAGRRESGSCTARPFPPSAARYVTMTLVYDGKTYDASYDGEAKVSQYDGAYTFEVINRQPQKFQLKQMGTPYPPASQEYLSVYVQLKELSPQTAKGYVQLSVTDDKCMTQDPIDDQAATVTLETLTSSNPKPDGRFTVYDVTAKGKAQGTASGKPYTVTFEVKAKPAS